MPVAAPLTGASSVGAGRHLDALKLAAASSAVQALINALAVRVSPPATRPGLDGIAAALDRRVHCNTSVPSKIPEKNCCTFIHHC